MIIDFLSGIILKLLHKEVNYLDYREEVNILRVEKVKNKTCAAETQTDINTIQRCSVENQKGTFAIDLYRLVHR